MEAVSHRPLFTRYHEELANLQPASGSAYVYAASVEERSELPSLWLDRFRPSVRFVHIIGQAPEDSSFTAEFPDRTAMTVSLKSRGQLAAFVDALGAQRVYLDVTGQDHFVWAGLLRALLAKRMDTMVVYIEPREYAYSKAPTEGDIFDLSEKIRGIQPIPGFASLRSTYDEYLLVPLLGFEGARLAYLLEQLQPENDVVFPVIGLPGFRPEYPFHAYWGNKAPLISSRAWKQIRFARANCPFSAFYVLTDISETNPGKQIRIAPIGTKPHALGAVLFALANDSAGRGVEIVYDHPIRKAERTQGATRVAVYHISSFLPAIST